MLRSRISVGRSPALIIMLTIVALMCSGCLTRKLKELEIRQLQTELHAVESAATFLGSTPKLDAEYGARAFVGATALNRFLEGLDNYTLPLDKPRGAVATFESARFEFRDGAAAAVIQATATDRKKIVKIKLRLRADIYFTADPQNGKLLVGFEVRQILPDVRLSIFRWREFWFAAALLRLEAQKYVDALPRIELELMPQFAIDLKPDSVSVSETNGGQGWIKILANTPAIKRGYRYRPLQAIALQDGLHLFFALEGIAQ